MLTIAEAAARLGPNFENIAADGAAALGETGLAPGAKVLDVGTGAGNFAIFLAMRGFQVLTGEPETDETHYARKDWAQNASNVGVRERITFEPFDASRMPFADASFDGVFFFGVLHHIDAAVRTAVFGEALRVVRPGGAVTFFEPRRETLERVWTHDPGHPLAALPADYAAGHAVRERRLQGRMMDIYIFRHAPGA
ncbi:MAG: class I SAM-dependent methyltransferase [Gammaproteobacteria bacterium]